MLQGNYYKTLFFIMTLCACFGIIFLSSYSFQYIFTLILFVFAFLGRKQCKSYKKIIIFYVFFILLSCLYSTVFNDQFFFKTVVASYPALGILSVYGISYFRLDKINTLKLIKTICFLFCVCYIIQWIVYPFQIFAGSLDETNINSEEFRMRMPCSICAYLLFFYGLEKLLLSCNLKYLLYIMLGFIPILVMGFRSLVALTIVMALLMIISIYHNYVKILTVTLLSVLLLFTSYQIPLVKMKVDEMIERQNNNQTFDNSDYIRYIEYEYFTENVFTKPGEKIIGAGYPVMDNTSKYGRIMYDASHKKSLYWIDLGLVGLSFIIGIPAVCILIYIVLLCCIKCKEINLLFIRFTCLTVLIGSIFTSMELFRSGNLIIVGLLLYYEYLYHEKMKIER